MLLVILFVNFWIGIGIMFLGISDCIGFSWFGVCNCIKFNWVEDKVCVDFLGGIGFEIGIVLIFICFVFIFVGGVK